MDRIDLGASGRRTSRLGYGCSSLMGATGRKESLLLLEQAFDAGIRHFDVAPSYGYGSAEGCLGEFLSRHGARVTVTTKYGIPPAGNRSLLRMGRQFAGPVLKLFPGIKRRLARVADTVSAPADPRSRFSIAEAKASLHRSLTELRREHIEVLLLHEAEANDLADDGLLRFLEESVSTGKVGIFGVGSCADKLPEILARRPQYCDVLQSEWSVLDKAGEPAAGFTMYHRALTENFRVLHSALVEHQSLCRRWSCQVDADLADAGVLAALMLKASIVFHPSSVILFSSRNSAHMVENVRVAEDSTLVQPARSLYQLVQSEGIPGHPQLRAYQL